jgi:hypothetical protein
VGVPAGRKAVLVRLGRTRRQGGQGQGGTYSVLDLGFASTETAFGSGAGRGEEQGGAGGGRPLVDIALTADTWHVL